MNEPQTSFTNDRLLELLKKHGLAKGMTLAFDCYPLEDQQRFKDLQADLLKELPGRELTESQVNLCLHSAGLHVSGNMLTHLANQLNAILSTPRGQKFDDGEWEYEVGQTANVNGWTRIGSQWFDKDLSRWFDLEDQPYPFNYEEWLRRKRQPVQGGEELNIRRVWNELEVVQATKELGDSVKSGDHGTVVAVYKEGEGYEVEFPGEVVTCKPSDIEDCPALTAITPMIACQQPQPSTGETESDNAASAASKICNALPHAFTAEDFELVALEISMFIRTLERQRNEARTNEIAALASRDRHLDELNEALARVKELEKKNDSLDVYIKKMDSLVDDLHIVNSCINPYEDLKRGIEHVKTQRDTALADKAQAIKSAESWQASFDKARGEVSRLTEEVRGTKKQLNTALDNADLQFKARQEAEKREGKLKYDLTRAQETIIRLERTRDDLTTKLKAAEEARNNNADVRDAALNDRDSLQSQLKDTQTERNSFERDAAVRSGQIMFLREELSIIRKARDAALADAKSWSEQADMHATTAAGLVKERDELQERLSIKSNEATVYGQRAEGRAIEIDKLKQEIISLRQRGGRLTVEDVEWVMDEVAREPQGIGTVARSERLARLFNSRLTPTWTPISTPPTEKDADRNGNVEYLDDNWVVQSLQWNTKRLLNNGTFKVLYWRRTDLPNLPPIEPEVEDDGFEEWWGKQLVGKYTDKESARDAWKAALAKRGEGQL